MASRQFRFGIILLISQIKIKNVEASPIEFLSFTSSNIIASLFSDCLVLSLENTKVIIVTLKTAY